MQIVSIFDHRPLPRLVDASTRTVTIDASSHSIKARMCSQRGNWGPILHCASLVDPPSSSAPPQVCRERGTATLRIHRSDSSCHANSAIVTASCISSLEASCRCKHIVHLSFLICSPEFHGRFLGLSYLAAAAYCRFLAFRHSHGVELRSSLPF